MNKQGIELAASFIVVLIISIIIFGLASALTYKLFCASENKITQLDASTQKQVDQLLQSGGRVTIPDASKTTKATSSFCGSSVAGAVFALGVRNDLLSSSSFTVSCEYAGLEGSPDFGTNPVDCANSPFIVQPFSTSGGDITWNIDPRERASKLLVITPTADAKPGKNIFNIRVSGPQASDFYGGATIYLTVQ